LFEECVINRADRPAVRRLYFAPGRESQRDHLRWRDRGPPERSWQPFAFMRQPWRRATRWNLPQRDPHSDFGLAL